MKVAELIAILQKMPQDVQVAINGVNDGAFYETIESIVHVPVNEEYNDPAWVVIEVNDE